MLLVYPSEVIAIFMHNANKCKLFALLVTLGSLSISNYYFLTIAMKVVYFLLSNRVE